MIHFEPSIMREWQQWTSL